MRYVATVGKEQQHHRSCNLVRSSYGAVKLGLGAPSRGRDGWHEDIFAISSYNKLCPMSTIGEDDLEAWMEFS